jgi:CubicO group peptidase (beta-lactamase class C family)
MSDYGDDPELFPNAMGKEFRWGNEDYLSTPEFYSRVKNVPLRHPPGTRFLYSNFAYFLLSQVVESVSGKSLRDFAAENIFLPLGMTHTQFNDDVNRVINNEAVGYHKKADGQYELFMTNLPWVGDGGVYTSIDDFLAWDQNYYHNRLGEGRQELIDIMQTPGPHARETGDEGKIGYAMGLEISENHGHRQIAHSGSWVAFTSYYARIPDLNFSVIAMCNSDQASAGALGKQVVDIYLE